ncbi:MAG: recombinase family protein [Chloroflexi bacterium]|nr:recombinase family protein [Chloroflexota bacterium]
MQEPKSVGIWIRVSTEDQAKGESPEHHEKRARLYAEAKGWKVEDVYHLEAVSGKSVMEHPETQRMLHDAREGRISGLIFSKLARLARNTRELLEFSELFEKYHADLISLQEAIDTSTPAGRLFYTVIAAMAQWEREEIAERVKASVPVRAKLGKPLGGQAPFGYQWVDKKLVPHPQESPIRRRIYELFLEHKRRKTVARLLNEAGYRTRTGAGFSDSTVTRLLEDPVAKGLHRANYARSLGTGARWVLKPEEEWVYNEVEPIVSEELWERCHYILESQRASRKPPSRKTVQLFSGLAFCVCGSKMYVPSNSPKYTCAKCRNKIGVEDLEEVFQEQLKSFLFSPADVRSYLDQADQQIKQRTELQQALTAEERKTKQEMDRVYNLYIDDQISREGFGERYRPLEERLHQIGDEIVAVQSEIDFLRIQYLSSDEILSEAQDLHARWPQLTYADKRKIIENVVENIIIGQDDISINLSYLPTAAEMAAKGQHNPRGSSRPEA